MVNLSAHPAESPKWSAALASLQQVTVRPEIVLEEVPAPARLAPHTVAIAADVVNAADDDLANGRFVVLHDPGGQDTWDGPFRIVTFIKASIETDVIMDDIFDEVVWSWLMLTLEESGAIFHNISGTVTRTVSRSFAALENRALETELELRASWTPQSEDLVSHLTAWTNLLEMCAGLVPLPPGVTSIVRSI